MIYDYRAKKIVAVLSPNLSSGSALNVVGHMAIALGAQCESELIGRSRLLDASGVGHAGISRYPLIITKASVGKLKRLMELARQRKDIWIVDFPEQMLTTGHDDELATSLASVKEEDLTYLGVLLYGEAAILNKLTGKFSLWQ